MSSRRNANLWWWLPQVFTNKYARRDMFKRGQPFTAPYFWHDSFGQYWNRLIGCRSRHKKVQRTDKNEWHCFACEKPVEQPNE